MDDAGYGDFSCHGHPFLRTPQIDRLHGESVRLTDFHVAPRLNDFVPVSLGAAAQNLVLLTSSDWQDAYADNSNHVRNAVGGSRGGPWNVQIERAGTYEIALRRWPFDVDAPLDGNIAPPGKALPITAAKLTVAGRQLTAPAAARQGSRLPHQPARGPHPAAGLVPGCRRPGLVRRVFCESDTAGQVTVRRQTKPL